MKFCEKLDFLMNISNTTNSHLAASVNLDPSHISRLRRGKRRQLKDKNSLFMMADFFSRRCTQDYQQKSILDILNIDTASFNKEDMPKIIMEWLSNSESKDDKITEAFLENIASFSSQTEAIKKSIPIPPDFSKSDTDIYYGIKGKRLAVERFLSEVILHKEPQTLLLWSDEPTDWMTTDSYFAIKWASMMAQTLQKGNKIKIIHNVSRNFDETLEAVIQWMPLYMTGAIKPYYYPRKRDGVFNRTLFIAPKTSALMSNSIGGMVDKAANFYFRDQTAISALEKEFTEYLGLCKRLMKIFTSNELQLFINNLLEFEREKENGIIISESLSLVTMPEDLISNVLKRIDDSDINFKEITEKRILNFKNQFKFSSFTEIIRIQDPKKIMNGEVKITLSDIPNGRASYYTLEEYILHLENILYLLNKHKNFNVHLIKKDIKSPYTVYVKENIGAIIAKTSYPAVVISFSEGNLTAGFWDYLKSLIGEKIYENQNKEENKKLLKNYIESLKSLQK